jgi:cell division protein FtsB
MLKEKLIRYKYHIILLAFAVWMLFFDRNSMIDQYRLRAQYDKTQEEQRYYKSQIEKAVSERDQLFTSDEALEKFAREKYRMKKDDEEVFILVNQDE